MSKQQPKTVLITGAASGIGAELARSFAGENYQLLLTDINQPDSNIELLTEKQNSCFIQADLAKPSSCREIVDQGLERFGTIDILINNAGFQHVSPVESFPEDVWDKMIAVMLSAPFLLTKYVWPGMKQNRWGRIINLGSIHSKVASANKVGYISAKHGLIGLTKTAALEGGPLGITVNAICPAYVRTPLVENQIDAQAETLGISRQNVISDVLLKSAVTKNLIEPDEIASLVLYLCSENARSVTGASWNIDCGWTAQ